MLYAVGQAEFDGIANRQVLHTYYTVLFRIKPALSFHSNQTTIETYICPASHSVCGRMEIAGLRFPRPVDICGLTTTKNPLRFTHNSTETVVRIAVCIAFTFHVDIH